jgi:hypothetical protein
MLVSELKTALFKYGFNANDPWLQWMNEAYHAIEIERKRWPWLEKEETKELLVAGEGKFVLTSPVKRVVYARDVTKESATSGEGIPLQYIPRTEFERKFRNQKATGNPEYFTILGTNEIQVWPVPTETRKIRVVFIKELVDLANEAAEPPIPQAFHYCIVMGAAYIALMSENEEERANTAQGQFEAKLQKLVEDDMERQIGEAEFVEEVEEDY